MPMPAQATTLLVLVLTWVPVEDRQCSRRSLAAAFAAVTLQGPVKCLGKSWNRCPSLSQTCVFAIFVCFSLSCFLSRLSQFLLHTSRTSSGSLSGSLHLASHSPGLIISSPLSISTSCHLLGPATRHPSSADSRHDCASTLHHTTEYTTALPPLLLVSLATQSEASTGH